MNDTESREADYGLVALGSLSKEYLVEYTKLWEGESFPAGRPKVPDAMIGRIAFMHPTGSSRRDCPPFQFGSDGCELVTAVGAYQLKMGVTTVDRGVVRDCRTGYEDIVAGHRDTVSSKGALQIGSTAPAV